MPFFAVDSEGVQLSTADFRESEREDVYCRECGCEMWFRERHERNDHEVAAHFAGSHGEDEGSSSGGAGGGGGGGCGESDEHKQMKSIVLDRLLDMYDDYDRQGLEVDVETRNGTRRVDVLVEFPEIDERLGSRGVVAEVQYEHEDKDIAQYTRDICGAGFTLLWLGKRQFDPFGEERVELDKKRVKIANAKQKNPIPDGVPDKENWSGLNCRTDRPPVLFDDVDERDVDEILSRLAEQSDRAADKLEESYYRMKNYDAPTEEALRTTFKERVSSGFVPLRSFGPGVEDVGISLRFNPVEAFDQSFSYPLNLYRVFAESFGSQPWGARCYPHIRNSSFGWGDSMEVPEYGKRCYPHIRESDFGWGDSVEVGGLVSSSLIEQKGEVDRSDTQPSLGDLKLASEDKSVLIGCECGCSFGTLADFKSHINTHPGRRDMEKEVLSRASINDLHREFR
jgi:hypothetical protein